MSAMAVSDETETSTPRDSQSVHITQQDASMETDADNADITSMTLGSQAMASLSQTSVPSSMESMDMDEPIGAQQHKQTQAVDNKQKQDSPVKDSEQTAVQQTVDALCRMFRVSLSMDQSDEPFLADSFAALAAGLTTVDQLTDLISLVLMERLTIFLESGSTGAGQQAKPVLKLSQSGGAGKQTSRRTAQAVVPMSEREMEYRVSPLEPCKETELMSYLMESYERVCLEEPLLTQKSSSPLLSCLCEEARLQITSHAGVVLQGAFTSVRSAADPSVLLPYMLNRLMPGSFLHDLVASLSSDTDSLRAVFEPLLHNLAALMRRLSLDTDDYKQPLAVLSELCEIKVNGSRVIGVLITHLPNWLPPAITPSPALELQKLTFLGPFFALSIFAEDTIAVVEKFYPDPTAPPAELVSAHDSLRLQVEFVRQELFKVFHGLVLGTETRDAAMSYLAAMLERNAKRSQLRADTQLVCGDGFMLNMLTVMQQLSVKVKVERVDPFYPNHPKSRVIVKDDSRFRSSLDDVRAWQTELDKSTTHKWEDPKFATECFFMCLHCHHLSIIPLIQKYQRHIRAVRELQQMVDELEKSEPSWSGLPMARRNRDLVKRWKSQVTRLQKSKLCTEAALFDMSFLNRCVIFYSSVARFLVNTVTQSNTHGSFLPLPDEVPMVFSALPDYFLEDIADFFLFVIQYNPLTLNNIWLMDLVTVILVFTCSAHYITNRYLVAKLIEIMFVVNPKVQPMLSKINDLFLQNDLALSHLAQALMRFYADIETTGASSEFYDKFSIRYHISLIFKTMWAMPVHQAKLIEEARGKYFVKFVNMLMNDTTYLLDESMETLKSIREAQDLMDNKAEWDKLTRDQQQAKQKQLTQEERQCRSYLTLAAETVEMFYYLTDRIQDEFLIPELADRLAAMLNFNLQQLCGPKCNNLKVRTPEKYGWEPKRLLNQMTDIYLHLDRSALFPGAIANDERSYSRELFDDAISP